MKVTNNHPRLVNLRIDGKMVRLGPGQSAEGVDGNNENIRRALKQGLLSTEDRYDGPREQRQEPATGGEGEAETGDQSNCARRVVRKPS